MSVQQKVETASDDAWKVLKAVSIANSGPEAEKRAWEALLQVGDLESVYLLAIKHGLAPSLFLKLRHQEIRPRLQPQLFKHAAGALWVSRAASKIYAEEAGRIVEAVDSLGIPFAVTKGLILEQLLSDGDGSRRFGDLDLMIDAADSQTLNAVLVDLGFVPNVEYDPILEGLVPISRASKFLYRLSPDHLPHYHRMSGVEDPPFLRVDVALSLTWHSASWQLSVADALRDRVWVNHPYAVSPLPTLPHAHHFLFLITHLYREARFWDGGQDVRLAQFADLVIFARRYSEELRGSFSQLVLLHNLNPIVDWVAVHLQDVFGIDLKAEMCMQPAAAELCDQYYVKLRSGEDVRWAPTMDHRLRDGLTIRTEA